MTAIIPTKRPDPGSFAYYESPPAENSLTPLVKGVLAATASNGKTSAETIQSLQVKILNLINLIAEGEKKLTALQANPRADPKGEARKEIEGNIAKLNQEIEKHIGRIGELTKSRTEALTYFVSRKEKILQILSSPAAANPPLAMALSRELFGLGTDLDIDNLIAPSPVEIGKA